MIRPHFSIKDALLLGFQSVRKNFFVLVGTMACYLFFVAACYYVLELLWQKNHTLHYFFYGASGIFELFITAGLLSIGFKIIAGGRPVFWDLFSQSNILIRFVSGTILFGIICLLLPTLLVIPTGVFIYHHENTYAGISLLATFLWVGYFGIMYRFFAFTIVDRGVRAVDSLRISAAITKRVRFRLFILFIVSVGVVLIGYIPGLIVISLNHLMFGNALLLLATAITVPIIRIAHISVYRKLMIEHESNDAIRHLFPSQHPV